MRYLITGGCGFLGSNLAGEVLKRKLKNSDELCVFDNLSRIGSEKNLEWLNTQGEFKFFRGDIRNSNDVNYIVELFKPDVIFHVAGQVAMTTSLERPMLDFETNVVGSINVLEAMKKFCPQSIILYSSTNKVYGDLNDINYSETDTRYCAMDYESGFSEDLPLDFRTPYGCSKGSADQYIKDAFSCYGIRSVVFRHSSIYGGRQFSSYDQGWIGWFVSQALSVKNSPDRTPFTISGTGKQVRDVLHAEDIISCYFKAAENIDQIAGQTFNIGGGMENSLSLIELFKELEQELSIDMKYEKLPVRSSDQKVFVADTSKAEKMFGWTPKVSKTEGLRRMIKWVDSI